MWRFLVCLPLAAGCAVEMDTESAGGRGEVVSDCVVAGTGVPASVELREGSLWMWEQASALVAPGADPCAGLTMGPALVPLLLDEVVSNGSRTDGRRLAPVPRAGFQQGGTISIYYDLVLYGPGFFDAETLGTGLCTTTDPATPCTRDETLVFEGDRGWPVHGAVGDDGNLYLAGCYHAAAFEDLCGAARVPIDRAADPTAYEYFSFTQGWTRDARQWTVAFENAGALTLGRDPALGGWIAVTADVWTSTISLRASAQPWDGWSSPSPILVAEPPPDWFIGGGLEHAALRGEGGRLLAITYGNPDLHFVTVRVSP